MKSTISIRQAVSAIILLWGAAAMACGPYYPMIPMPSFFELYGTGKSLPDYEREENLRLWQALTSERIPLADIEQAVYRDSRNQFFDKTSYNTTNDTGNQFYTYLNETNDREIIDLLLTAKDMEERWRRILSPWHYPRERGYNSEKGYSYSEETGEFGDILNTCLAYRGTRFKDRYALQGIRALFASRQYARCVEYYDSAFASISDDNLMKRMAERYVAGCWSRLGETKRANAIFARTGDVISVSASDNMAYMAKYNPDTPLLMDYIRHCATDSAFMAKTTDIAGQLLKGNSVTNRGDWYFIQAYYNGEYTRNIPLARKQIYQASGQKFSSDELKDLAHAYKMKLDAKTGNTQSLLSDLKRLERKIGPFNPDSNDWVKRLQNIVYADLVPELWRKKDYTTAIMLCSYADNIDGSWKRYTVYLFDERLYWCTPSISLTINDIRKSKKFSNPIDYSSLSFQMMGSLTSKELAAVYAKMMGHTPLYDYLRKNIRTDSDYYNDLIGTLALREGDYARAEKYLSQVSDDYQQTMNVSYYLTGDAFACYLSYAGYDDTPFDGLRPWLDKHADEPAQTGAKLRFARKMLAYKHIINHGRTNDDRGLARIMYTIGRRNSFEEYWAITQYWRGTGVGLFRPYLTYYPDDDSDAVEYAYSFLYNYDTSDEYDRIEAEYNREIEAALAMLESDESKAKAEYILGNLKTVVARYGDTTTGRFVKTSCDRWKLWI